MSLVVCLCPYADTYLRYLDSRAEFVTRNHLADFLDGWANGSQTDNACGVPIS